MKRTRQIIQFLNLFPQIKGRVWVDLFSAIALYKFFRGLPVDVPTLGLILGTYVVSSGVKQYLGKTDQNA